MKKLIFVFLFLFSVCEVFSQPTTTLFLVDGSGDPITGLTGTNLKFRRSPYTSGDVIPELTVTEHGSQGTYKATGFIDFELVKLFINDVEQTWWGEKYSGDLPAYIFGILEDYVTLSTSQTITGTKAFSAATTTFVSGVFTGAVSVEGSFFEAVDPYINNLGDPYLLYQHSQNSLTSVRLNDSLYGRKFTYADGDKERLFTGKKLYGRTNTVAPFEINTSQFYWGDDKLNLLVFAQDSISSKRYNNWVDSTWMNLGEPVSKYRMMTLRKTFWNYPSGYYDWKWFIQSVSETGAVSGKDSAIVINHGDHSIGYSYNEEVFGVDTWSNLDTILLPERGTYSITYGCELIFPYTEVYNIDARDSVQFRLIREFDGFDNVPQSLMTLWKDFKWFATGEGTPIEQFYQPESNPVSRTFTLFNQYSGSKWILQIRADLNTVLINVAATKPIINQILLR